MVRRIPVPKNRSDSDYDKVLRSGIRWVGLTGIGKWIALIFWIIGFWCGIKVMQYIVEKGWFGY